jgi:hypothetical protein
MRVEMNASPSNRPPGDHPRQAESGMPFPTEASAAKAATQELIDDARLLA